MVNMKVFTDRMQTLRNSGKKAEIDAFLVVSDKNMRYLAGFSALAIERFAGILVPVDAGNPIVIVPKLEESKARERSVFKDIKTYSDSQNPAVVLGEAVKELGLEGATFGVEGFLPFRFYRMLIDCSSDIKTRDASALFSELRIVKSEEELGMIEKAADVVAEGIRAGIDFIKPGVNELTISCQIERVIKERGGENIPFCIVLSGSNSALPHGETSNRKVGQKDVVLMDVGATYKGYYGDLTRTVFVGKMTKKEREIYDVVAEAHEKAIGSVRPGIKAEKVDAAARGVIENAGYGQYFTHRTGHGLGLDVHEEPYICEGNKITLLPGMVFTIEPGIYLSGKFGVRIEDNIAVSNTGKRMLSHLSKEFTVVQS
jgi:Xaa-Pro aminopeptidase